MFTGLQSRTVTGLVDNFTGTLASGATWVGPMFNPKGSSGAACIYGSNPQTQVLALGAFSIVSLVYTGPSFGSASGAIARRNDGNTVSAGWQYCCNSQGTQFTMVRATTDFRAPCLTTIPQNTWVTVAVTYDGSLTLAGCVQYLDGVVLSTSTATAGAGSQGSDAAQVFSVGDQNFVDGGSFNAIGPFQGWIDTVYIWRNRVLTPTEILDLTAHPYKPVQARVGVRFAVPRAGFRDDVSRICLLRVGNFAPLLYLGDPEWPHPTTTWTTEQIRRTRGR